MTQSHKQKNKKQSTSHDIKKSASTQEDSDISGNKSDKNDTIKSSSIDEGEKILNKYGFQLDKEGNNQRRYKRIIPPEKSMVRRTAEEFRAGAEPVRGSGSHRLVDMKVRVVPELREAIRDAAKAAGQTETMWMRAAARKALRESMDVDFELETEVVLLHEDGPTNDDI